jgi:hypothetical protein
MRVFVIVDFDDSYRLSGGMCGGGTLNFDLIIRETLLLFSPRFSMAFTLRLCFPFFFFFFVFLFTFREIQMFLVA